jgi:sulfide dehydrogenase cytochrome subunit
MRRFWTSIPLACVLVASPAGAQTVDLNNGRLLASNCMQCHGTRGQPRPGFESLSGEGAREIVEEMAEMARMTPGREPEKDLMVVHAKAYTRQEIDLIAKYLASR